MESLFSSLCFVVAPTDFFSFRFQSGARLSTVGGGCTQHGCGGSASSPSLWRDVQFGFHFFVRILIRTTIIRYPNTSLFKTLFTTLVPFRAKVVVATVSSCFLNQF